jgi:hypothetical protein
MRFGLPELVIMLVPLAIYGTGLWILWKFYCVFARIGEELSEIKTVLRLRLPPPSNPANP